MNDEGNHSEQPSADGKEVEVVASTSVCTGILQANDTTQQQPQSSEAAALDDVKAVKFIVTKKEEDAVTTAEGTGSGSSTGTDADAEQIEEPQSSDTVEDKAAPDEEPPKRQSLFHQFHEFEAIFCRLEETAHEKIYKGQYTKRECRFVFMAGSLGCFNYGFINGVCVSGLLSSTGKIAAVAGLAGRWTDASINLAKGDVEGWGYFMCLILSYMVGSFLVGLISPNAIPYQIDPKYGPTFMLGALFLFLASLIAAAGVRDIRFAFFLAAAANGVQNGVASLYSANLIRCSLTGVSIDFALLLAKAIRGNKTDIWRLLPLSMIILTFFMGGACAWWAVNQFLGWTLLFSAALFFLLGISLTYFIVTSLDVSTKSALLGTWVWNNVMNRKKKELDELRKSVTAPSTTIGTTTNGSHTLRRRKQAERQSMLAEARHLGHQFLLEMFDKMDLDHNGSLDAEELLLGLVKLDPSITARDVKNLIEAVDLDGDRRIDRQEWELFVNQMTKTTGTNNNFQADAEFNL